MKIVKLNRRYTAYKSGFTHALRFTTWGKSAGEIEQFLTKRYGHQYSWQRERGQWSSNFGSPPRGETVRPYWINLKNEADISMILLSGNYKVNR